MSKNEHRPDSANFDSRESEESRPADGYEAAHDDGATEKTKTTDPLPPQTLAEDTAAAAASATKPKRRWSTIALAAAGVAGIVVGSTSVATVNALTDDSHHSNSGWDSGAKQENGKPQPPSGNMPQPPGGGEGPQPPSDGQGGKNGSQGGKNGSQGDSGNEGSASKKSSKWGKNATSNKQNQDRQNANRQQSSDQSDGSSQQDSNNHSGTGNKERPDSRSGANGHVSTDGSGN